MAATGTYNQDKLQWRAEEEGWVCSICHVVKRSQASCTNHAKQPCKPQNPPWQHGWDRATMGCRYCGQMKFSCMEKVRNHIVSKECPMMLEWYSAKGQGVTPPLQFLRKKSEDMGKMKWSEEEKTWICSVCQIKKKKVKSCNHHNKILCCATTGWRQAWDYTTKGCRYCGKIGFKTKKKLRDHIVGNVCPNLPSREQGGASQSVRKMPVRNMAGGKQGTDGPPQSEPLMEGLPDLAPGEEEEETSDEETSCSNDDDNSPAGELGPESNLSGEREDEDSDEDLEDKGNEKATGKKGSQTCDLGRANRFWKYSKQTHEKIFKTFLNRYNKSEKKADPDKMVWSDEKKCWTCTLCQVTKFSKIACKKHSKQDCLNKQPQNPSWQLGWDRKTMSCRYCGMTGFQRRRNIRKHIQNKACPKLPNWNQVLGKPPNPKKPSARVRNQEAMQKQNAKLLELQARGLKGPGSAPLPGAQHNFKAGITAGNSGVLGPVPETAAAWNAGLRGPRPGTGRFPKPLPLTGGLLGPIPGQSAAGPWFPMLARNPPQFPGPSSLQDQLGSRFEAPKAQIRPVRQADSRPLQKPGVMRTYVDAQGREPGFEKFPQTSGQPRLSAAQSGAEDWPLNSPPRAWPSTLQQQQASRGRPESWAGAVGGPEGTWSDSAPHTSHTASWQTWPGNDTDCSGNDRDHHGNERDHHGNERDHPGNERDYPGNDRDYPGNDRGHHGNDRDNHGNDRDHHGNERDHHGNDRDRHGNERDYLGNDRDRHGNERDHHGNERDRPGNDRDRPGNDRDHPKILSERSAGYYGERSGPERFNERSAEHKEGRSGPERFNERSAERHGGRSGPERFNERSAEHNRGRSDPERFNERSAEHKEGRSGPERFNERSAEHKEGMPGPERFNERSAEHKEGRSGPERFNERSAEHKEGRSGPERFNERSAEHKEGRSGPERFNERSAEHHEGRSGPERFHDRSAERHGGKSGPERFSDNERSGRLTSERICDVEMSDRFSTDRLGNHERSIYDRCENDRETRRQQDPYRGGVEVGNDRDTRCRDPNLEDDARRRNAYRGGGDRGNDRDAQHRDPNWEDDARSRRRDPYRGGGERGNDRYTRCRDPKQEGGWRGNDDDTRRRDSYLEDRQRNDSDTRRRGHYREDHRRDRSPVRDGSWSDHRHPEERDWDSYNTVVPRKEQRYY